MSSLFDSTSAPQPGFQLMDAIPCESNCPLYANGSPGLPSGWCSKLQPWSERTPVGPRQVLPHVSGARARQIPPCTAGAAVFFRAWLVTNRSPETFSLFVLPSPLHNPPTHRPDTNHGSRYASSDLHAKGLAEGSLAGLQQHCLHGRQMLLLQEPGTATVRPAVCSLTSSIDRVTRLQTLKERFAELLPEKIEQIKALRK